MSQHKQGANRLHNSQTMAELFILQKNLILKNQEQVAIQCVI